MRTGKDAATITYGPGYKKAFSRIIRGVPFMAHLQRFVSFALLILGVALVFLGLTRSLGVTPASVLASVAAVAALLYTGGVWFGSAAPRPRVGSSRGTPGPILFDRDGRLIAGPAAGQPVASQFPESLRPDIERHCAAALAGRTARFLCTRDGRPRTFDVLPVLGPDGTIVYGVVVSIETDLALAAAIV
jgi:hypothetical protein